MKSFRKLGAGVGLLAVAGALVAGIVAPKQTWAAVLSPFQVVDGDGWLTSNARHESGGWTPVSPARPAFALELSNRNDMPFEKGTAGATVWVRQPGCARFAGFGEPCGWQLGLAVTQFRSLVVGGHGIEIDGLSGERPYGRVINASDGRSRMVGLLTNTFADFSGVDAPAAPSWFAGIDLDHDAFAVRRSLGSPRGMEELVGIDRQGDLSAAGSVATTRVLQRGPGQWAVRARLANGSYTFHFEKPFEATPVCVATGEGTAHLHVKPSPAACTITSERATDDAMVDVVVVGDPS